MTEFIGQLTDLRKKVAKAVATKLVQVVIRDKTLWLRQKEVKDLINEVSQIRKTLWQEAIKTLAQVARVIQAKTLDRVHTAAI